MSNEKLLINDNKSNNFEFKSNNEIEEMANCLTDIQSDFNEYCAKPCRECELGGVVNCENYYKAKHLYEQGYRKQIVGEWIMTMPSTMRVYIADTVTCSICGGKAVGLLEDIKPKYCPHCGAKMVEN